MCSVSLDDDIAARQTEQARLQTMLRQRHALDTTTMADQAWVAQQSTELEERIAITRELIAEYGDRILDAYQADHPAHA